MKLKAIRDIILQVNDIDIFEQSRRREVIEMRSVANKYMRKQNKKIFRDIVKEYKENGYNTTHCSIIHSLNTYKQHCKYNKNLELTYKHLLGDTKLYVMENLPKATDQQIELIEEILLG
jgi:hypothetical protein